MKILFYSHSPRAFRTTLIGHLFEIAQVYPTVLVSEALDPATAEVLGRNDLFPTLERVIRLPSPAPGRRYIFTNNRALCKLAKRVIQDTMPDLVIVGSDLHSSFERYLCRFAKRANALVVAIQPTTAAPGQEVRRWLNLETTYLRFPRCVPRGLKLMLTWVRKMLGHTLEYWLLPCLAGTTPFWGTPSNILGLGNSGMRDADFQIVLSRRDWTIYHDDGVPREKLYILSHPLARDTKRIFEIAYLKHVQKMLNHEKRTAVVFLPGNVKIGFRKSDESFISQTARWQEWKDLLRLMREKLTGWTISARLHPDTPDTSLFKERLESLGQDIVVSAQGYADEATEQADLIVGFPLSASTTLFTASLQCPSKPILSLDLDKELLGDVYRNYKGIHYISSLRKFEHALRAICTGAYKKPIPISLQDSDPHILQFPDMVSFLKHLNSQKSV